MVAMDGVEWNYVPLDGLILYPNVLDTEYPRSILPIAWSAKIIRMRIRRRGARVKD